MAYCRKPFSNISAIRPEIGALGPARIAAIGVAIVEGCLSVIAIYAKSIESGNMLC